MSKISEFLSENFPFLVVNFSIYLNRRVFVMTKLQPQRERLSEFNSGKLFIDSFNFLYRLCPSVLFSFNC